MIANFSRRFIFRRWAPDIGENRELPDGPQLFLELAVDLTQAQLSQALAEIAAVRVGANEDPRTVLRAGFVAALSPYVRVHGGPHTVDGKPLGTLEEYITLAQEAADYGSRAMKELIDALRSFNSFTGADELFSLRRSGGSASTAPPSVVKVPAVKRPKRRGR